MVKSRTEQLVDLLRELQMTTHQIEGSWLFSGDGHVLAMSLPMLDGEDYPFWYASLFSIGQRLAEEYHLESTEYVIINGTKGHAMLIPIGKTAVLITFARKDYATILANMQQIAPRIASILN